MNSNDVTTNDAAPGGASSSGQVRASTAPSGPPLSFDPKTHTYKLGDIRVPSVTEVLTAAGFIDTTWFKDSDKRRGSAIHIATELFDRGKTINADAIASIIPPDELHGYLHAWQDYLTKSRVEIVSIERLVHHPLYRYAGRIDRIVLMPDGRFAIIDIKTGGRLPSYALQTSGYAEAAFVLDEQLYRRFAVTLRKDGTFRVDEHKDRKDRGHFLSAVDCWHWKERNGLNADRTTGTEAA